MTNATTDLVPNTLDFDTNIAIDNVVFPNLGTHGIQVDQDNPGYCWHDLLGRISIRGIGGADPGFVIYRGNIRQFKFDVNDEAWVEYHIPHDYVPNTDLYTHAHWSLNVGGISETITWGFEISYAKGHNQDSFTTPVTTTVSEATHTTAYRHMITETIITGPGLLDKSLIEPDGLILVRVFLSGNTGAVSPFLHMSDIHYQSTGIGTKNKSPNFYS